MRALLAFSLIAAASTAQALTVKDAFKGVTTKSPRCFVREYSQAHLRKHPKQTVQKMNVRLGRHPKPADDPSSETAFIEISLILKSGESFNTQLACMDDQGNVLCAVDCDGGSVTLNRVTAGRLSLRNNRYALDPGCSEDETNEAKSPTRYLDNIKGGDDLFELKAQSKRDCGKR